MTRDQILEGLKMGETLVIDESMAEYAIVKELQAQGLVTITPGDHGLEVKWNGNNNQNRGQPGTIADQPDTMLPRTNSGTTPV